MKKLNLLFVVSSLMLFTVSLQAQATGCAKVKTETCNKPCAKITDAGTFSILPIFNKVSKSEKTTQAPQTSCAKPAVGTVATAEVKDCKPANCLPQNCLPGCKPINCKPANCSKESSSSTAVAVNLKKEK